MLEIGSGENTVKVEGVVFHVLCASARREFMILYTMHVQQISETKLPQVQGQQHPRQLPV